MKQNEITDTNIEKLEAQDLENLFNVYSTQDGSYFYNLTRTVNFPTDVSPDMYSEYIVERQDTWPLISYKNYNTVLLGWMLCRLNNITNPIEMPEPGSVLKILNVFYVRQLLSLIKEE